jgi:hypothetical protein
VGSIERLMQFDACSSCGSQFRPAPSDPTNTGSVLLVLVAACGQGFFAAEFRDEAETLRVPIAPSIWCHWLVQKIIFLAKNAFGPSSSGRSRRPAFTSPFTDQPALACRFSDSQVLVPRGPVQAL